MVSDEVKRKIVNKNENCSFLHILPFHSYRPVCSVEYLKKNSFTLLN
jgi:hypothetical protein